MPATATLAELIAELEDLWRCVDELMDSISESEWSQKHGKDWIMADVPYHLAYFDREMCAEAIERGLPGASEPRPLLKKMRELDQWNAEHFAQRPTDWTVAQSRQAMADARDRIRRVLAPLSDSGLERPIWIPLAGLGERTVRSALWGCIMHTWSEFTQLRLRLKRSGPLPSPAATHRALDGFMHMMPGGLNRAKAAGKSFAVRFRITGPGSGDWLLRVEDGACSAAEDATTPADLTLSMAPETFAKIWNNMQNPLILILTRQVKVSGLPKMGTFGKLFPPPKPESEFDPALVAF